jgi:HNH endonuclease
MAKKDIRSLREKFFDKVQKTDNCWNWIGPIQNGYGRFRISQRPTKMKSAHRFSYEAHIGPIPSGLTIDHLCRNRSCVNPSHMEVVSIKENVLRGESISAINSRKLKCIKGHAFSKENTSICMGRRVCKSCRRIYMRNRRKKLILSSESS